MSQFILDDQLSGPTVLIPLRAWATAQWLHRIRPREQILDDRVPSLLLTVRQPTFLTIDRVFWNRTFVSPQLCDHVFRRPGRSAKTHFPVAKTSAAQAAVSYARRPHGKSRSRPLRKASIIGNTRSRGSFNLNGNRQS